MWVDLAKSLLPALLRSDADESPLNGRPLPHASELTSYALRGYAGPAVVISGEPYEGARRASAFIERHVAHMNANPGLVSACYVERDVVNILELVTSGPVRILPTVHPRP
jgi:hypothetical protein